ncbi:carbon monoxide dehydrogenase subunit G [Mycobacterium mantenii]|uniref:Carbon monoxide dehydrogenase n=1 Tax=Mycobacterium mantenii TaxID=560555 RepID=A0A1X0FM45_MYCNT|nr:SRPBCC family protein [Mycobacterium mantenii]MCV7246554.1 SRPBCC family protein [Mycobacterium mantenii]ORB02814.1 carbon monoxide dehydrogenase [Mycobacterium mantenii]BBY38066.1 carbon monoxide dehydrogenase subunit G [Mycobacterium mantenii]
MELVNEFRVPVSIDQAWDVLTDVQRVVPCIPGAQLLSVDGDEFTGAVKVKVGPITVSYQGNASFQQKDASNRRAVISANGKETRGSGNASAVMTAQLKDEGDHTTCVLTTDLTISGKAAQFGRGVLADVSGNLIAQFAQRLEADVAGADHTPFTGSDTPPTTLAADRGSDEGPAVDMLKVVALPLAKRAAPVVVGLAAGVALGFLLGRRKARPHPAALRADDLAAALSRLVS